MNSPQNREPGIYGGDERTLTEIQLQDIALHVKSVPKIWARFSKITANDHVELPFVREISQEIIDYLKDKKLVMSGAEKVQVFRILREFAESEQKASKD
jgi:hypothetical protein